jgi:hypothetical protein
MSKQKHGITFCKGCTALNQPTRKDKPECKLGHDIHYVLDPVMGCKNPSCDNGTGICEHPTTFKTLQKIEKKKLTKEKGE